MAASGHNSKTDISIKRKTTEILLVECEVPGEVSQHQLSPIRSLSQEEIVIQNSWPYGAYGQRGQMSPQQKLDFLVFCLVGEVSFCSSSIGKDGRLQ